MLVRCWSERDLLPNYMTHSVGWLEIDEKGSGRCPPGHLDGDGKIGEPPLWRRSHVEGLQIHGGARQWSHHHAAVHPSVRKATPVVDAEMYGAGLTGENAD